MNCRRLFSFFRVVFTRSNALRPILRGSLNLQLETLYRTPRPTSARTRAPQISDSLVSLTFGLCDFPGPRDSLKVPQKTVVCLRKMQLLTKVDRTSVDALEIRFGPVRWVGHDREVITQVIFA